MLRERVFLRFDFYVLIVPINFCKLCELASHVGVLSDMFLDFSSFPFLRAFFFCPPNYKLLLKKPGLSDMPTLIECPSFD